MVVKDFKYRGYSIEELKKMDENKLAEVMPSRIRRKMKRGMKIEKRTQKAIAANVKGEVQKKPVKTHKRDVIILPSMVGMRFSVYNGKTFENLEIKPEMVGFYFGEFIVTRKRPVHSKAGIGATKSSKHVGKK